MNIVRFRGTNVPQDLNELLKNLNKEDIVRSEDKVDTLVKLNQMKDPTAKTDFIYFCYIYFVCCL